MNPSSKAETFLAPAKLNLDLRIIGRREDGYHELESIFCLVGLYDKVYLAVRDDEQIELRTPIEGVLPGQDLTVRAAACLQQYAQNLCGVDIWLEKRIPMGGGLGGGSSDAATVLMALNRLWRCNLSRQQLIDLGVKLGADVPFFIFGRNAFARGVGEKLSVIQIPDQWYVVVKPDVHVSTQMVFTHKNLTRNSKPSIMPSFKTLQPFRNDMQAVVLQEYRQVDEAFQVLKQYGQPLMTGSGACLFVAFENRLQAEEICNCLSDRYQVYCVEGLQKHPMFDI